MVVDFAGGHFEAIGIVGHEHDRQASGIARGGRGELALGMMVGVFCCCCCLVVLFQVVENTKGGERSNGSILERDFCAIVEWIITAAE